MEKTGTNQIYEISGLEFSFIVTQIYGSITKYAKLVGVANSTMYDRVKLKLVSIGIIYE